MLAALCVLLPLLLPLGRAADTYLMGEQGASCTQACLAVGMNCNNAIQTNNSTAVFTQLGVNCTADSDPWWATNQPGFVSGSSDPNFGKCLGWTAVPSGVVCSGSFPTVQRLCRCTPPSKLQTFGTGLSSGEITTDETYVFSWVLAAGDVGAMTHFWTTYPGKVDNGVIVRYYIDGETNASIEFTPSLACGVGFYDTQAPWGTKWFGKGAADAGWFNNFRIPFTKSVLVTVQHQYANYGGFYMIVRGGTNLPLTLGGITVPPTARLNLFAVDATYQPLDWITLANVPTGMQGLHFMSSIAATSGNLNFLEACFHMYTDGQEFPGTLLSTGTEDYFDSAWYFNAGQFHLPVSGFTHLNQTSNSVQWSAYRFHEIDPLQFNNGFQFMWRVGDAVDAAGIKCLIADNNNRIVGSPTATAVRAYSWVYTWPSA